MEKEEFKPMVLFSNYDGNYGEEEYEKEKKEHEEEGIPFYDSMDEWASETSIMARGQFEYTMQEELTDGKVVLTGLHGRWDGKHRIVPEVFDCIEDAFKRCEDDSTEVLLEDGYISVHTSNHDASSRFEIHLLSDKGIEDWENDCFDEEDKDNYKYLTFISE